MESVRRVVQILEALGSARGDMSLNEVVQYSRVHRSSAYRILEALVKQNWVTKAPDTLKYSVGPGLLRLKFVVGTGLTDVATLREVMEALREKSGETATLSVVDGTDNLVIEVLESNHPVKLSARVGFRIPLSATASSRVLLAYSSSEQLHEIGLRMGRVPYANELAAIREKGYAMSVGELDIGATAIAAPVRNSDGVVVSALGICGPTGRFGPERTPLLIKEVVAAADMVSRNLGWKDSVGSR